MNNLPDPPRQPEAEEALIRAALPDATILCRCECVTVGDVRRTMEVTGAAETNRAKAFSRVGMGRCQGRYCSQAGAEVIAAAAGDRFLRGDRAKLTADRVGYMAHPNWVSRSDRKVPPGIWQPRITTREGLKATARWYREKGWL